MIHWREINKISPKIDDFDDLEISQLAKLGAPQADRFCRTRTFLRQVLGAYLHIPPRMVEISYTPLGKPFVKHNSIYFNLSHSQNLIVIALHDRCPLGIDLEQIKPRQFHLLISRYFALEEQQWFQTLAEENLAEQFYRSWVMKEAYAKLQEIPLLQALAELNTISITAAVAIEEILAPIGFKCALAYGTL